MNIDFQYDVYVAFAEADQQWVEGYLVPSLNLTSDRVMTRDKFQLGASSPSEYDRAVKNSRYTILVLSQAFLSDQWMALSESLVSHLSAMEQQTRLIPLLKEDCEIPLRLDFRVKLDCSDPVNWERETERLRRLLETPPPPSENIPCPYPGMAPFSIEQARYFFGREKEVDQLVYRLKTQNYVIIIGPSGCGKSSLIFAGLVAELEKKQQNQWQIRVMHPGDEPLLELAKCLGGTTKFEMSDSNQVALLKLGLSPSNRFLLVIDQFEELFAQTEMNKQLEFINALKLLRRFDWCTIVLTMRADFYPDLINSPLWPVDSTQQMVIGALRRSELRLAIQRPAQSVGVFVEASLLERLLADAADEPGALPLLQETMVQLWEKMQRHLLTITAYEHLGRGALSGLVAALATRADAVLAQLTEDQRALARRIFVRLVQFGEGRADTRRQQTVTALRSAAKDESLFEMVLSHLTRNRLLIQSGEEWDSDRKVDIAHEALISEWPTLRSWVVERREAELTRRRLEDKAHEWLRLGGGPSGLLDSGELAEAERWLNSPGADDLGYASTVSALVEQSSAAIQEAERNKELAHQREITQAETIAAEQKQRAESERKARRVQRYLLIVLTALLTIAAIVAFLFLQQLQISKSRELSASAISQLDVDPERSILLSLEALKVADTKQARDALRRALLESHIYAILRGHTFSVMDAEFSSDGKNVVTAGLDKTVRVWEPSTGRQRALWDQHTDTEFLITCVIFSSDDRQVAVTLSNGKTYILDALTGNELLILTGHTKWVNNAAFTPDSRVIATSSVDGTARLWDASTGRGLLVISSPNGHFNNVAFSPDGRHLVTAGSDTFIRVWETVSGREIMTISGHSDEVKKALYSPDGKQIVSISNDGTARIWDAASGQEILRLPSPTSWFTDVSFSPDGKWIVAASSDKTARIYDVASGRELLVLRGHTAPVVTASFSPDGNFVITAGGGISDDETARIWDTSLGHELATIREHDGPIETVKFSSTGENIMTVTSKAVHIRNALTSRELLLVPSQEADFQDASFSPSGDRIVTADSHGLARIWDANSGNQLKEIRADKDWLHGAAFSPDGKFIATGGSDNTAHIWEVETGRESTVFRGHDNVILSIAFSPDGKRILTASSDGSARIWDIASGHQLFCLCGHKEVVNRAVFSPDGRQVVTSGRDGTARIWDATTGSQLLILSGHTGPVKSGVFSLDGKEILTTSEDGTARVWDASSGDELAVLLGHEGVVNSGAFSPDGKEIITGGEDGTARRYLTQIDDLVTLAYSRLTRGLTCEERRSFLHESTSC